MARPLLTLLAFVPAASLVSRQLAHADPVLAVGGDAVHIEAEELVVDVAAGEAVLTGKVKISKGDLTVSCPRIDLRFEQSPRVTWLKGSGGVSADLRGVHAEAPTVELDMSKHVMDLRGGVRLTRGQGWLTADSAKIAISTGKVSLSQVKGSLPAPKGP